MDMEVEGEDVSDLQRVKGVKRGGVSSDSQVPAWVTGKSGAFH